MKIIKINAKREDLTNLYSAIERESWILRLAPKRFFPQIFNRLYGLGKISGLLKNKIDFFGRKYQYPWFRLESRLIHTHDIKRMYLTEGDVTSCLFSRDGMKIVYAAGIRNTVDIIDASSGVILLTLKGHTEKVTSCSFNPDENKIVSSSFDSTLRIWDVSTGKHLQTLIGHKQPVVDCIFSPDGRYIVSASQDCSLKLWDAESGKEIMTFEGHRDRVNTCAFSKDGKYIVSGSDDNTVKMWDTKSGQLVSTFEGHTEKVTCCHFIFDSQYILSAGNDLIIYIWDTIKIQPHKKHLMKSFPVSSTLHPLKRYIAFFCLDKEIKLWDYDEGKEIVSLKGHNDRVNTGSFSTDGNKLISGGHDRTLRIWDIPSLLKNRHEKPNSHLQSVKKATFSPDGNSIASASLDETINIWNVKKGQLITSMGGNIGPQHCVAFSPQGRWIASGGDDSIVRIWDAKKYTLFAELEGHEDGITSCAFSPDEKVVATASKDATLKIWELRRRKLKFDLILAMKFKGLKIYCLFNPTGDTVYFTLGDNCIWKWNILEKKLNQFKIGDESCLKICSFSPDGRVVLCSDIMEGTVYIWNVYTKQVSRIFQPHMNECDCSYSPDGKFILTAVWADDIIKLWDSKTLKNLTVLSRITGGLQTCSFSPDERRIVVGDGLGQVLILRIENIEISPKIAVARQKQTGWIFRCPYCFNIKTVKKLLKNQDQNAHCPSCNKEIRLIPTTIFSIPSEIIRCIPESLASKYKLIPFSLERKTIELGMIDPTNEIAKDDVRFSTGKEVKAKKISEEEYQELFKKYYCP